MTSPQKQLSQFQSNFICSILAISTKIAQVAVFPEEHGTMKWSQFVLHIRIEKLKNFLVKNQLSDFKIIWQQSSLGRPLINKYCWFIENISHLSSGEWSGLLFCCHLPWMSLLAWHDSHMLGYIYCYHSCMGHIPFTWLTFLSDINNTFPSIWESLWDTPKINQVTDIIHAWGSPLD